MLKVWVFFRKVEQEFVHNYEALSELICRSSLTFKHIYTRLVRKNLEILEVAPHAVTSNN